MENMSFNTILINMIMGRFKWWRKRKGGYWTLVKGSEGGNRQYWANREPFKWQDEVLMIDNYISSKEVTICLVKKELKD